MLSSLRRVFRPKSNQTHDLHKKPASEPPPKPPTRSETPKYYSGIQTLHSSEYDEIDLVFVHGLKGDCLKTWKDQTTDEPWPKTMLPLEIGTARVLTYSYDATVVGKADVPSQNRISNHAANLVTALASLRQSDNANQRPIIFVCHSLGGLVCQDALVTARQRSEQHLQDIFNFTRGIIFLGTPHHGSSLAKFGELVSRSVGLLKETNSDIVQVLTRDSEVLARIQDSFQALLMTRSKDESSMIEITCFYEELPTKRYGMIVPKHSAILPGYISIGIHKNHAEMTKFAHSDEPGFKAICGELKRWMNKIQEAKSKPQKNAHVAHCLVPYTYNPDFVGRSEVLELLRDQLGHTTPQSQNKGHLRAALHGLGGIGKTQIALAYSFWLQETSEDVSVFWIHASSAERFSEAYGNIARECKIPGHEDPSFDALSEVKDWLESKESGQWLIIIDNADDMRLFFPQPDNFSKSASNNEDSLGQFIPECSHGTILITTRNMQVGSRLMKGKRPIEVGKMDGDESIQLLRQGLQGDESTEDLLQLSSRLEFLPLALVQAAAFIQENSITVNDYLELLDGSDKDLIDLLSEDFETVGRDSDTPRAVAQTWMLSFQQIEREYPFAGDLLSLMSLFDRQAIPLEFLEFYSEEKKPAESNVRMQLVKALGVLKAFCFIRADKGGDHNMHRLVQLVTRTWLIRKGVMAPFARDALLSVSDYYPYGYFEQTDTCTAYLSHAISVLDLQVVESDEDRLLRASMLHRVGGFFLFQGRYADAEKLQREGTKIRIELLGEEDSETFVSMLDLSNCLQYQAQYYEAEKLAVAILETCKQVRGEEHPQTLDAMSALASKYYDLDKEEDAKRLWTYVSETRKRVLGENHEDTLAAMNDLALTLEGEEQLEIQKHIIEVETRTRGADHPSTLTTRSNLAMARYSRGEVAAAEELMTEILEVRKRVLGDEHPSTVVSMMHLGQIWITLGTQTADIRHLYPDVDLFGDAKRLLEECVRLKTKSLGPNHPETLQAFTQLNECQEAMELADRDEVNRKAVESNGQVEL
ncbi:hypothetical protein KAF25_004437 [Fusarium avenaceum]|uniref:NB-ARC domain-containing protein n=1 Tax=Fusarium avenaceum TaxID=40199 RepID=A0A9P7H5L5_9HYPO|nr:hypothetical protein KAF25_004437 [Fusarium avenaceum]